MKIMHIGQMIGGLDIYIRNSIIYNKNDNEYIIVRGDKDGNKPVMRNGKAVKAYTVPLYRKLNPINDIRALIRAVVIIRKERPDIIHCHSAKGGVLGRMAGWLTNTKTFYTAHAFSFLCTSSKFKRSIYLMIERLTRFTANVLSCSSSEQEMAVKDVKYKQRRALIWSNAVPDTSKEKGKAVDIKEPFACYVGRPCYQKNTLFLLDVIRSLRSKGVNLKFVLLCVGSHSPELDALNRKIANLELEGSIMLEPWISHSDCQEYVRGSLFYITTSLYEGLPLSVIEAMANGKTIVASNVVGNRDCVKEGVNGWLLPLKAELFAEKIIELVNNETLRQYMENNSRKLFIEHFFIEKQIQLLQNVYELVFEKTTLASVVCGTANSKVLRA